MTGNWNFTSHTGREHELVEEAKRYGMILSTKRRGSELDGGWKLYYTVLSQQNLPRLRWGYLLARIWQAVLMNGSTRNRTKAMLCAC